MTLLEELKAKESELLERFKPMHEEHDRLMTELAMVQHGLSMLLPKKSRRTPLPDTLLDEAETMWSHGATWNEVARKLNVTVAAVQKAVERRRKGNPHRRQSNTGIPLNVVAKG
jgi:hypothetical protein